MVGVAVFSGGRVGRGVNVLGRNRLVGRRDVENRLHLGGCRSGVQQRDGGRRGSLIDGELSQLDQFITQLVLTR